MGFILTNRQLSLRAYVRVCVEAPDTTVQILAQTLPKMAYMSLGYLNEAHRRRESMLKKKKSDVFLVRLNIFLAAYLRLIPPLRAQDATNLSLYLNVLYPVLRMHLCFSLPFNETLLGPKIS